MRGDGLVGWYLFIVDPKDGIDAAAGDEVRTADDERAVNEDELLVLLLLPIPLAFPVLVRLMDAKGDDLADEADVRDRRAVIIFRWDSTSADATPEPAYSGSSRSGESSRSKSSRVSCDVALLFAIV